MDKELMYQRKRRINGTLSIIGTILHKLGIASISVTSILYPYIVSYLQHFDESLSITHGFFMYPIFNLAMYCSIFAGGIINAYIGSVKTVSLGLFILTVTGIGLYFAKNLILVYFWMFIFGLGIGVSDQVTPTNACMYFPDYRGTIVTFIYGLFELAAAGTSYLGEYIIINPDSAPASETGIYPYDIAKNVLDFIMMGSVAGAVFTTIGMCLIIEYNEKDYYDPEEEKPKEIKDSDEKELEVSDMKEEEKENEGDPKGENLVDDSTNEGKSKGTGQEKVSLVYNEIANVEEETELSDPQDMDHYVFIVLKSWRFWRVFIISFTSIFVLTLGAVVYKVYGNLYGFSESQLQTMVTGTLLVTAIFTPIGGIISDKFPFKIILLLISIGAIVYGVFVNFATNYYIYSIIIYFGYFLAGFAQAYPQHNMKVFGMKHFIEIHGTWCVSAGKTIKLI